MSLILLRKFDSRSLQRPFH